MIHVPASERYSTAQPMRSLGCVGQFAMKRCKMRIGASFISTAISVCSPSLAVHTHADTLYGMVTYTPEMRDSHSAVLGVNVGAERSIEMLTASRGAFAEHPCDFAQACL